MPKATLGTDMAPEEASRIGIDTGREPSFGLSMRDAGEQRFASALESALGNQTEAVPTEAG